MRLGSLSFACLLGSVIAAPITRRPQSTSVIDLAIKNVSASLTTLERALKSRPPGGSSEDAAKVTDNLLGLSYNAITALRNGATDIKTKQATLMPLEGFQLFPTLNTLSNQLQNVVNGWVDSKKMAIAGNRYDATLQMLFEASDRTGIFADTAISKLAIGEQTLSGWIKTTFTGILEKGIKVYQQR